MRFTLDFRISLSESETTAIAVAAYYAKMPINDWVKQQLLAQVTGLSVEKAVIAAVAVETAKPAELPATRAVAQPTEPPALEPPQAAVSDESVSRKKRKPSVRSVDKAGMPRGFYAVMEKAEKIHAGRRQVMQESGATGGRAYVLKLSKWYKEAGFGNLDNTTRGQLVAIGRNAAAIRAWHSNRPGSIPDDIVPSLLYRQWLRDGGTPVEPETPARRRADAVTNEAPPNDETLVFSATGIERRSLSEITDDGEV